MFPALSAELKFPNRSQILKKEKIRIHNLAFSIQYFKSKDNWNTLQNSPNSWDIRNIICEAIDILDRQFRVKGKCADELYLLTRVQLIASISRFNIYWWLCKHELLLIKSIFFSITCHLTVSSSTSRRRPTLQKRGKKTTQTSTSTTMMKSLFRRESQKAGDRIPKFLIVSSVKWTTFLLQLRQLTLVISSKFFLKSLRLLESQHLMLVISNLQTRRGFDKVNSHEEVLTIYFLKPNELNDI